MIQVVFLKNSIKTTVIFLIGFISSFIIFKLVGVSLEKTNSIDFGNSAMFFYILWNNIKVYFVLFLGLFLLKIPTYITLSYNAIILGFAFSATDSFTILLSILSHGILEISAFIIASTIAFTKYDVVIENKKFMFIVFLIGIIILIIAAFIETYVSPYIGNGGSF